MSDDIPTQILARLTGIEGGLTALEERLTGRITALEKRFVVEVNTKLDEILNKLSAVRTDADNTKSFLIEDALTLGRRMTSLEGRLEALEKKGR